MSITNIYCDESCHLPSDDSEVMVLGAVVCPKGHAHDVAESLRQARTRHGLSSRLEIKWGGVSPAKADFFLDVVGIFWDDPLLRYRAVIASKANLRHEAFNQTHDDWYHKMYYQLLKHLASSSGETRFHVYIDIKDTRSSEKLRLLHDVLCNGMRDFSHEVVERVQPVRSHEVPLIQLTDFLTGAVAYSARRLTTSPAKRDVIRMLEEKAGKSIAQTTWLSERKFNIFVWDPR